MEEKINKIDKELLGEISNLENIPKGAYNIRKTKMFKLPVIKLFSNEEKR